MQVLKLLIEIMFTLGGCGHLDERTNFCQFSLWQVVVDLKGWTWIIFILGGCGGLEMTYFGLLDDLALSHQNLLNWKLCVCRLPYGVLAELVNGQLSSCNQFESSLMPVLTSLSYEYNICHHLVDASEFICCKYISILPPLMHID